MTTTTDTAITLPAPAKLNLFLHVTGRRSDGYHTLQTLFQLLDYGDELRFSLNADEQLRLTCNEASLSKPDNLVMRAAQLLQQKLNIKTGADIHLQKRIPAGAGLGGGSSDAATTLVALNRLWQGGLSRAQLADLGLRLGADVPVFVIGHSAWAEGIGEEIEPVELAEQFFVVLTPDCHVTTATIFSHQQLTRDSTAIKMCAFLTGQSRNDCEALVRKLYPTVDAALNWLSRFAPARMTGTGSSVFAAFPDEAQARAVLGQLPSDSSGPVAGIRGFVARGINRSALASFDTVRN
jgi:4-diphosphocytidyl-2-C-methyl-D-erythritol kinase